MYSYDVTIYVYVYWPVLNSDFERSKLLNSVDFHCYCKMADTIHTMCNGNDVDAFSEDSVVILDSNQAIVEPIDQHKSMTTGCNFG